MKHTTLLDTSIRSIGLGCMGMSWAYGPTEVTDGQSVLRRSLELGVNHWDTADLYGAGKNEELLSTILAEHRDEVFLATKFGNVFDRSLTSHQDQVTANPPWIVDGTPTYARTCIENSLKRLGVDHVDLYYLHRVDALVPIEETVGAMAEFVKEGKTRSIGLSEASAETIRRAHAVHPIAAVQSELSLWTRDYLEDVLPLCAELGIKFVAYSPLGRGFLTGRYGSQDDLSADDARRNLPRFSEDSIKANLAIVDGVKSVAEKHGVTPGQVALAWVLAQGEQVVTIPGTKRVAYLEENSAADEIVLDAGDFELLNALQPPAGERYAAGGMKHVNL